MKKFTIVLDGIADRPQQALGGLTPMESGKYARAECAVQGIKAGRGADDSAGHGGWAARSQT